MGYAFLTGRGSSRRRVRLPAAAAESAGYDAERENSSYGEQDGVPFTGTLAARSPWGRHLWPTGGGRRRLRKHWWRRRRSREHRRDLAFPAGLSLRRSSGLIDPERPACGWRRPRRIGLPVRAWPPTGRWQRPSWRRIELRWHALTPSKEGCVGPSLMPRGVSSRPLIVALFWLADPPIPSTWHLLGWPGWLAGTTAAPEPWAYTAAPPPRASN
jgi:hypothetical protein